LFAVRIRKKSNKTITKDVTTPHLSVSLHYLVNKSTTTRRFVSRAIAQSRHRLECVVQQQYGYIEDLM